MAGKVEKSEDVALTRQIQLIISPEEAARRLKVSREAEKKLADDLKKLEKTKAEFESDISEKDTYKIRDDFWEKITPKDISTLKTYKNPPVVVRQVMGAVYLMLKGVQQSLTYANEKKKEQGYWDSGRKLLYDRNFIQLLKNFDPSQVAEATLEELDKIYKDKEWFSSATKSTPTGTGQDSKAPPTPTSTQDGAAGLCIWVKDRMKAAQVLKAVAGTKSKLTTIFEKIKNVQNQLEKIQGEIKTLEKRAQDRNSMTDED